MFRLLDKSHSLRIRHFAQICFITTLLMYPLLTFNYSSATQKEEKKKTVCSASIYARYQNRNHIPAAAIILANQHHLMHLAAVFKILMKHLCEKAIGVCPSSHRRRVRQSDAIGHCLTSDASETQFRLTVGFEL